MQKKGQPSPKKGQTGFTTAKKGRTYPHLQTVNHPKWKGGSWKFWRKEALLRDKHICQSCGLEDFEILEVDHIKSRKQYPDLIFNLDNLITLCPNCHRRKTLRSKDTCRKYD